MSSSNFTQIYMVKLESTLVLYDAYQNIQITDSWVGVVDFL